MTNTLKTRITVAVLAARKWDTLVALVAIVSQFADTLARSVAVALKWIASWTAFWHVAQISGPAW